VDRKTDDSRRKKPTGESQRQRRRGTLWVHRPVIAPALGLRAGSDFIVGCKTSAGATTRNGDLNCLTCLNHDVAIVAILRYEGFVEKHLRGGFATVLQYPAHGSFSKSRAFHQPRVRGFNEEKHAHIL
jgi:hypothetical protein